MPATSRSGERFSRRSGSERAGSPSKSRITQPRSGVSIVWPRWKSPCVRMTLPPAAMRESCCRRSRTSWPRPAIGARASVSGSSMNTRSICSSIVAVRIDRFSMLGSSGANAGSEPSEPSARVQRAGDLAEPAQPLQQALGIGDELVERELPAVERSREELLEDAEVGVHQAALEVVPARQRGDVREAARTQEPQQLELRVLTRLEAAERLQDQLLAEHDAGVGLLDPDGPHLDRPADARRPTPSGSRACRSPW